MKVLALDIGDKWTGVAVGDTNYKLALPHSVIKAESVDDLLEQVTSLVKTEQAELVVVGIPIALSGEASKQTVKTNQVVGLLSKKIKIKVVTFDERLTTRRASAPAALPTRRVDEKAAMYLLQDYLDQANLV